MRVPKITEERTRRAILGGLGLWLAITAGACSHPSDRGSDPSREETSMTRRPLSEVLAAHAPEWMALAGVQMVYEGETEDGRPCVKIGVIELTEALRARLPEEVEGWPVVLVETGEVRPLGGGGD